MSIRFYRVRDPYGCLSNFSVHGFELDGRRWRTVNYFQAQKFVGTSHEEAVRNARGPMEARRLGRTQEVPLRADWDEVRDEVMRRALLRKAETHESVRRTLLETGDEVLIEASPTDYYWGCGKNGTGENRLGKLWMEVREMLKGEK